MVQYQFAYDQDNHLVDVEDAIRHTLYSCPYCHDEMIPRQGQKNAWHYAHKDSPCSYSNYLYTIAKQRIMEWYNASDHVYLEYKTIIDCDRRKTCLSWRTCPVASQNTTRTFDLKTRFDRCETKYTYKKDGRSYTPDLILLNSSNPDYPVIFLEMIISGISHEKERMKVRTVDFEISSEEDIKSITSGRIIKESHLTRSVVFHDFRIKHQKEQAEEICPSIKESSLFSFAF